MVDDSSDISQYMDKIPHWVAAARPRAAGHPSLMYAVALADFMTDGGQAALNRTVEQVIRMTPFDPRLLSHCGWANLWSGQPQKSYDCFLKALRSGMQGLFAVASCGGAATAAIQLGKDDDAMELCARGLAMSDDYPTLYAVKAAVHALRDEMGAASEAMQKMQSLDPGRTLRQWRSINDYGDAPGQHRYFDALVKAGLPLE